MNWRTLFTAADLGVITQMRVAQLDPAKEADSRFLQCDRGCWKRRLWSARFSDAYCRRPSAPPRKMTEDPVQCRGQTMPARMSAFSRHVSIMVRLYPSRKAPVGGGAPIACTSGWDVPMT